MVVAHARVDGRWFGVAWWSVGWGVAIVVGRGGVIIGVADVGIADEWWGSAVTVVVVGVGRGVVVEG